MNGDSFPKEEALNGTVWRQHGMTCIVVLGVERFAPWMLVAAPYHVSEHYGTACMQITRPTTVDDYFRSQFTYETIRKELSSWEQLEMELALVDTKLQPCKAERENWAWVG